jgi:hypothetical protein
MDVKVKRQSRRSRLVAKQNRRKFIEWVWLLYF